MVDASDSSRSIIDDGHRVKGLTFATMRRHLTTEFGQDAWDALVDSLPRRTRALLLEADIAEWYPESEMRRVIHAVHDHLAGGDDERFLAIMRGVALAAINRFFRMLLGLASGRFVLRKVPVLWRRLRQGPAVLESELAADGRVLIHYRNFRYCRDPIYRLLSIANCQAGVLAATGAIPEAELLELGGDSMTLAFRVVEREK